MVLLIILHTKSKSQLKHILPPLNRGGGENKLIPQTYTKKEELSLLFSVVS